MWRGLAALLSPHRAERQALFHQTLRREGRREGGWRAAVRPNPNGGRSSPASHSDHIRGAGSVRSGPAFGQRHRVYVHVCACAPRRVASRLIAWLFVKNRKLWLASTWFSLREATAVRARHTQRGKEMWMRPTAADHEEGKQSRLERDGIKGRAIMCCNSSPPSGVSLYCNTKGLAKLL